MSSIVVLIFMASSASVGKGLKEGLFSAFFFLMNKEKLFHCMLVQYRTILQIPYTWSNSKVWIGGEEEFWEKVP